MGFNLGLLLGGQASAWHTTDTQYMLKRWVNEWVNKLQILYFLLYCITFEKETYVIKIVCRFFLGTGSREVKFGKHCTESEEI